MLLGLIQWFAVIGLVCLVLAWRPSTSDMFAIVAGLLGMFVWGVAAYGLLNIETVQSSTTYSEPALALFAVACAVVSLVPALVNPFDNARPDRTNRDMDNL